MNLIEYFAVIDDEGRKGPFATVREAATVLTEASKQRGHTDEQARQFFLDGSAVVKVETKNGKVVFSSFDWLAREEPARQELPPEIREALPEMIMAKAPLHRKRK